MPFATFDCIRPGNHISREILRGNDFASRRLFALSIASGWCSDATTGFPMSLFIARMP